MIAAARMYVPGSRRRLEPDSSPQAVNTPATIPFNNTTVQSFGTGYWNQQANGLSQLGKTEKNR
jgi:hypothetical protein